MFEAALPSRLAGRGQGEEARAEAVKMLGVYSDLATSVMGIPVISGSPRPPPHPPPSPCAHKRTDSYRHTHVLADRQPVALLHLHLAPQLPSALLYRKCGQALEGTGGSPEVRSAPSMSQSSSRSITSVFWWPEVDTLAGVQRLHAMPIANGPFPRAADAGRPAQLRLGAQRA